MCTLSLCSVKNIHRYTNNSMFGLYLIEVDDGNVSEAEHVTVETIVDSRHMMETPLFICHHWATDNRCNVIRPS